jgi:hypothetical protein
MLRAITIEIIKALYGNAKTKRRVIALTLKVPTFASGTGDAMSVVPMAKICGVVITVSSTGENTESSQIR